jgi:hypothetical protein
MVIIENKEDYCVADSKSRMTDRLAKRILKT